ncbi:hypothetical protein CK203_024422 [Vitis vinifera]|uniref:DUF4283 domain-containing protein n=1 Tax=Vitis vinifera TaxID=29760 RepID=A0A438IY79_VITVI|nr:hypothetical protein CK203_024422 [Vitis vinifera]
MKMVTKVGKVEKSLGNSVEGEKKEFVDVAREPTGRIGDASWLQFRGRELRGVKVMKLGGAFLLLEFEDEEEAERVLKKGVRCYKDKLLHLERWSEEVGCLHLGSSTKEVWVRVVGLLPHCWSGEVFKKFGDCCGGFIEVPPWVSAVVSMNKLKGSEGEKVREDREVGSHAGSSGVWGRIFGVQQGMMGHVQSERPGVKRKVMEMGLQKSSMAFQALGRGMERRGV